MPFTMTRPERLSYGTIVSSDIKMSMATVVMLPFRVVMLPAAVMLLGAVVMLPPNAVEAIAAVSSDIQRID